MLRSSGFLRGVECPFGPACGRPYCHFRHPPGAPQAAALLLSGPTPPPRRLSARPGLSSGRSPSAAAGCGYDPYNPELPKPVLRSRNGALEEIAEAAPGILELELVNKAIEAVKNEVEREQKKYKELLETTKEYSSSEPPLLATKAAGSAATTSFPALEYTPAGYNPGGNTDYNPTPLGAAARSRSSKYTLDSFDKAKCKGSSLEYVPTIVTQPKRYSCPAANSKYTVDNSKPSTDLEYDPLSNYSARLLSKAKEEKGTKRKRAPDPGEAYSPSLKKHCDVGSSHEPVARFSDSEEEREAAPILPLKSKGGSESKLMGGAIAGEKGTWRMDSGSRQMKETAVQYDMGDIESPQKSVVRDSPEKDAKLSKGPPSKDTSEGEKSKGGLKDKTKKKNADDHAADGKKKHSNVADKEKVETNAQRRNGERREEKRTKPHVDGHVKKRDEHPKSAKAAGSEGNSGASGNVVKGSSAEKAGNSKQERKAKARDSKIKAETRRAEGKDRKGKQPASKRPKEKLAISSGKGNSDITCKAKRRALSHADLFGDESGDEGQAAKPLPAVFADVSSDSDGDDSCFFSPQDNGVTSVKQAKMSKAAPSSSSSSSSDELDYSVLENDLDFESDPMEECLRIFNESTDIKTEDKGRLGKQPSKEEETEEKAAGDSLTTLFPGQKRRISHVAKQGSADALIKPVVRPYRPPTAQEACYQRIQLAQKQAAQLAQLAQQRLPSLSPRGSIATHKGEKKRIAHVPNAALPAVSKCGPGSLRKTGLPGSVTFSNGAEALSLKARTLAGMASKTTTTGVPKRVAHAPTLQSAALKRPVIPTEFGAKVPTNIRQRYLNLFIDECLKSCPLQQKAFDKALAEEKVVYDRSTSRNIYLNVAVNTLKKLRSLLPSPTQDAHRAGNRKMVSHEAMLGGKLAAKTSFTLNRSATFRVEDLTGASLYQRLKEYVLTEEELKEHGYPLPCPEVSGRAVVFTLEEKKTTEGSCRVCCRCGTEYMVTPSGNCVRKEECIHHWGKLRKQRVPGGWETHYNCCSGAVGSPGCQVAKQHVHDGRKDSLEGFVKTFEKMPNTDGNPGIYALDCEMCYTKLGLELTRVTVINSELKVIYDTFVKPDHKVVDYNTRFSGVTEADLETASITLRDVQAVLLSMFSTDTILIGHSLESDLFALKLMHRTVVDTAVVFPHRLGLPYKRALRTLMADYLKRIIQDSASDLSEEKTRQAPTSEALLSQLLCRPRI
ncbi:RNA exonuclease 1 homolog isoform X2 [Rhineura floridana]|uniref:RNA exonuclease 1 homolog isoform X2 n=1 Tax=Rhineura floridana TaxID=261503 RepID=UPI002AC7F1B7|nr:RNA exonuclease 1 homolog isoform X2 [Rhineura floridana]